MGLIKMSAVGRGMVAATLMVLAGFASTGCQIDTHAGIYEESVFWGSVASLGRATWFQNQARAAINRGDLEGASGELDKARKQTRRMIRFVSDEPSEEFFLKMEGIHRGLGDGMEREIRARKQGATSMIEAETVLRHRLKAKYRRVMRDTDFGDFAMSEPTRREVEKSLQGTHDFLDCLRKNKVATDPNAFGRCNDRYRHL